jgi:hypothetical protein
MTFNRTVGNIALPTTSTGATTLAYLDPAIDILLALFKAGINGDLGPAWDDAKPGTQLDDRSPVESTVPHEPTAELLQSAKITFPALFVYRTGEGQVTEFTRQIDQVSQRWTIDYVMGPLVIEEIRKLGNARRVVADIIREVLKVGGHPTYAMDDNNVQAKQVLTGEGSGTCGFKSVGRAQIFYSPPPSLESPTYWATRIEFEAVELGERTSDAAGESHVGGRFFFGTGTGQDADASDDDNGIIEEEVETISTIS